jgi:hypothetical protein
VFGELPKILDRNFVIAFFLPVVTFIAASLGIIHAYNLFPALLPALRADLLIGTTIIGLATWLGGTVLLVTNRDIYRLFEGYGRLNPLRLLSFIERQRYRELQRQISKLDAQYDSASADEALITDLNKKRGRLLLRDVEQFPDSEDLLLPSSFGNTIRAFEVYSRVMYGFETIQGWSRLLSVIPGSYLKLVDDAKAQTDFWVNLRLLSCLFIIEYAGVAVYTRRLEFVWLPIAAFIFSLVAARRAKGAAVEWGELVKAAFDIYLPALLTKLQFPFPSSKEEELKLWREFSQAIIYRWPELVPVRIERLELVLGSQEQQVGETKQEAGQGESKQEETKQEKERPEEAVEA